jgi:hypothetical protein
MGTPPASSSLNQMRNVQRKTRFGGVEAVTLCATASPELSAGRTGTEHFKFGISTATSKVEAAPSSLTRGGVDGRALFLSAAAQHALFGQLPGLQLSPIGGLETGHADAGKRIALTKSAVTIRTASGNRFVIAKLNSIAQDTPASDSFGVSAVRRQRMPQSRHQQNVGGARLSNPNSRSHRRILGKRS